MGAQGSKDDASVYMNGANRHNDILTDKENRKYKRYTIHHKRNNENDDILDIENMIDDATIENHLNNNINNNNNNNNNNTGVTTTTTTNTTTTNIKILNNNNNNNNNNLSNSSPINNNINFKQQQQQQQQQNNLFNNEANINNSFGNNCISNSGNSGGGVKSKFLNRKNKAKTVNLSNTTTLSELNNSLNSHSNSGSVGSSSNSFADCVSTSTVATSSHSSLFSTPTDNNDSLLSLSSGVGSSLASLDEVESIAQHPVFSRSRSKSLNIHNNNNNQSTGSGSGSLPKENSPTNNNPLSDSAKIQGRKSKSSNALLRTLQRKVKKEKSEEQKEKKEKEKEEKQKEKEEKQREKKEKEREKEKEKEREKELKLSKSSSSSNSPSNEKKKGNSSSSSSSNSNSSGSPVVPEQSEEDQQNKSFENIVSVKEENNFVIKDIEFQNGNGSFYEDIGPSDTFQLNPLSPNSDSVPPPKRKPPPLPPKNFRSSTPNTSSSNLLQFSMDASGVLSPLSLVPRSPLSRRQSNLYPPSEPSLPSPCSSQRNSVEIHKLEDIYNYALLEKIGSGTFSDVHLCRHKETEKMYAIKIIDKSLVQMIASHTDLDISTEVNILSTLSHPHVINLIEHFESEMNYYIVMEYLPGGELLYQLEETHNNPDNKSGVANYTEQSAREIIKQIIHAVAFLHKNNIVHRDLKPENILFNGKSEFASLKIIDFGLASYYKAPLVDVCGTPDFQAPEMIKRLGYSYPVDIWATGVILYILLCGRPPFQGKNSMAIMSLIMKAEIKFDKPEWENVSESAKDLISKMLDPDPAKRLTAEQVLQHEWMLIQSRQEDSPRLSGTFHKQLRRYNSQRYFKATGDTLLKSQRFGIYSPEMLKRRSVQL